MTTTLPPDVADLLRAIRDALAYENDRADSAPCVRGALDAVLLDAVPPKDATRVLRRHYPEPSTVCDTCHSEPVTVIDGNRRQCSTCALRVCDCCQVRRATTTVGCVEMCPLCAERSEAEVAYTP